MAFGFLVARGLTQRLQRLVVAADGWSQGNVLHLIADGLSNADIAARLVISEKTVKSHVSNILSKLQLADRTQAAVWAWRMGVMGRDRHT